MKKVLLIAVAALAFASCATSTQTFTPSGAVVNFDPSDFEFSAKKTASATTTRIVGIDFENLFVSKSANVGAPIVSAMPLTDKTANKAAFNMLSENPGYDVVFYPTVEMEKMSYIVMSTAKATIHAKLGRLKK